MCICNIWYTIYIVFTLINHCFPQKHVFEEILLGDDANKKTLGALKWLICAWNYFLKYQFEVIDLSLEWLRPWFWSDYSILRVTWATIEILRVGSYLTSWISSKFVISFRICIICKQPILSLLFFSNLHSYNFGQIWQSTVSLNEISNATAASFHFSASWNSNGQWSFVSTSLFPRRMTLSSSDTELTSPYWIWVGVYMRCIPVLQCRLIMDSLSWGSWCKTAHCEIKLHQCPLINT